MKLESTFHITNDFTWARAPIRPVQSPRALPFGLSERIIVQDPPSRTDPSNYSRPVYFSEDILALGWSSDTKAHFFWRDQTPSLFSARWRTPSSLPEKTFTLLLRYLPDFDLMFQLVAGHTHTRFWRTNPDSYSSFSNFVTSIGFGYLTRFLNNFEIQKLEAQVWKVGKLPSC